MPRNKRHGNVSTIEPPTDTTPTEEETADVSTDTDTTPQFNFTIEDAPEGYQPERKSPGRVRTPSPFDDAVLEVKGQGWKRIPHDGDVEIEDGKVVREGEMVTTILRELEKAKLYHKLGMDKNVTETHVEFRSRDLQPRTRKNSEGDDEIAYNGESNETLNEEDGE